MNADADEDARFATEAPIASYAGTARRWAKMQPNLSILVDTRQTLKNGVTGRSEKTVLPEHTEYNLLKLSHELEKPGDCKIVSLKLVSGDWIILASSLMWVTCSPKSDHLLYTRWSTHMSLSKTKDEFPRYFYKFGEEPTS